jgi:hypothetical protein
MPNVCKICKHPNLKEINIRLVKHDVLRNIANDFEVTESSLFRHQAKHLPRSLSRAYEKTQIANNSELIKTSNEIQETALSDSFDIMSKIDFLLKETEDIYNVARNGGQNLLALKSLDH